MSVHEPRPAIPGRPFELSDSAYQWIQHTVKERAGINLTDAKREMVYNRIARILRRHELSAVEPYIEALERGDASLVELINAVTTNVTSFFREAHHFERLAAALPEIVDRRRDTRTIRIWSAGCSTGEEAYSIAIALEDALPREARTWDVHILATDIDTDVLATARAGIYPENRIATLDDARRRWFQEATEEPGGGVRVCRNLARRVSFEALNLMDPWPVAESFDVIFCRNVVIYFDKATQKRLFARFAERLPTGGLLFIGHSESLYGVSDAFEFVGQSSYRKRG